MSEISRSLLILKLKQPFLDWTRTLDDKDQDVSLEEINQRACYRPGTASDSVALT